MTEPFERVFVANGELHAQQVRAFLEAGGIQTSIRGEALRNTHGLTLNGLGRVEIFVQSADAAEARSLLESAEKGEFSLEDGGEEGSSGAER
jgi:hypothetical protein